MGQEPRTRFGISRELLVLAGPLVLSNAFWTLQLTIDRVMLSRQDSTAVGAAMVAGVMFWTPFALVQVTAAYAATFVAQYVGAGRPQRVGPAIWQALYFSLIAGVLFMGLVPAVEPLMRLTEHAPNVLALEITYLRILCFSALPMLIVAVTSSFFSGRGNSWPVLAINGVGTLVNAVLDYAWIYGRWGFPEMGIAGAGWATVVGSWVSAALGLALVFRSQYRREYATLSGWRPERELFGRLMRFGIPGGLQYFLEALAFNIFLVLVGRLGTNELSATSIAFTINMTAIVPMVGLAQAVSVLVGQRLGENRPDLAAKFAIAGVGWCLAYTAINALVFVGLPGPILFLFEDGDAVRWTQVAPLVPVLLRFVAVYCLFESISIILSSALRGAGDTRFVSLATMVFAWSLMVLPAIFFGDNLHINWTFATGYLVVLSFVFIWRFRQGKWRSMRVIEAQ